MLDFISKFAVSFRNVFINSLQKYEIKFGIN